MNSLKIATNSKIVTYRIIRFIKKYKPIVLVLNAINPIPKKYVYAHIVCHTLRLLSDVDKYQKINNLNKRYIKSFLTNQSKKNKKKGNLLKK